MPQGSPARAALTALLSTYHRAVIMRISRPTEGHSMSHEHLLSRGWTERSRVPTGEGWARMIRSSCKASPVLCFPLLSKDACLPTPGPQFSSPSLVACWCLDNRSVEIPGVHMELERKGGATREARVECQRTEASAPALILASYARRQESAFCKLQQAVGK